MSKPKMLYRGSMVIFYMICRFGWKLYQKNQPSFAELSEEYTPEFGVAALKAVDAAQAMPDVSQRRGSVTQQGNELDASSKTALLFWKKLRRFIRKAYAKPDWKAVIAQAGGGYFAKASKGSYTDITQLLTAGQTFLQDNTALLLSAGKMPATFAADYNKAKDAYDVEHIDFGETKGSAADGTTDKVVANNAVYTALMEMFGNAQTVFEDKKTIARQFAYDAVKRLVTKDLSGIHFRVMNPATKKPVPTALITSDESADSNPVNERGVLDLRMKVGVHSMTVTAPGFAPYSGVIKVDAGVMHRVTIELLVAQATDVAEVVVKPPISVFE